MKIAVLIPCYNVEKYLAECLDSVLAAGSALASHPSPLGLIPHPSDSSLIPRTHPSSLSIFCCDDGSKDGTLEVLKGYSAKHPEVRYVTQPNAGVSAARNRLLDELPEDFDAFAFVDADDTVQPEYFSRLEEAMTRTGSDVAEYAADLVKEETLIEDTSVLWLKRTNPGIRSAIVGKLISRQAAIGIRLHSELKYEEDLMYSYEVNVHISKKVILPGFPYYYRPNPTSATQRINWRDYVESACRRVELFREELIGKGLVPPVLREEFERELFRDSVRICIVKNLRKNPDPILRRELFYGVAECFRQTFNGLVPVGWRHSPVANLIARFCSYRWYHLTRLAAYLI